MEREGFKCCILYFTYLGPWLHVEHRPSTTPRHCTLFCANLTAPVQFVLAAWVLTQCLASSCCKAGLSSSFPAGSRSELGVWCWMLASWGCVRSSPTSSSEFVLLLVPVPLAPTALHLGSSLAIGCCRWAADRCMENINEKGGGIEVVAIDHHVGIKAEMKRNFLELEHQLDKWHLSNSITTKLTEKAKKKECADLSSWIRSISNHFWWCAKTYGRQAQEKI